MKLTIKRVVFTLLLGKILGSSAYHYLTIYTMGGNPEEVLTYPSQTVGDLRKSLIQEGKPRSLLVGPGNIILPDEILIEEVKGQINLVIPENLITFTEGEFCEVEKDPKMIKVISELLATLPQDRLITLKGSKPARDPMGKEKAGEKLAIVLKGTGVTPRQIAETVKTGKNRESELTDEENKEIYRQIACIRATPEEQLAKQLEIALAMDSKGRICVDGITFIAGPMSPWNLGKPGFILGPGQIVIAREFPDIQNNVTLLFNIPHNAIGFELRPNSGHDIQLEIGTLILSKKGKIGVIVTLEGESCSLVEVYPGRESLKCIKFEMSLPDVQQRAAWHRQIAESGFWKYPREMQIQIQIPIEELEGVQFASLPNEAEFPLPRSPILEKIAFADRIDPRGIGLRGAASINE